MKTLLQSLLTIGVLPCSAPALVLDSFTQAPFTLANTGRSATSSIVETPFGSHRIADITGRLLESGTTISSTLSTASEDVTFSASGRTTNGIPLQLKLGYTTTAGEGPYSLLGYSAFQFDFTAMNGQGNLIIELGSESEHGPEIHRIPIFEPGVVSVPFDQLNWEKWEGGQNVESFSWLLFTFEAVTPAFGFTLAEISLVPEPASYAILLGSVCLGFAVSRRRRRKCPRP